ncbi:protein TIFY 5A [Cucumis sativus]|uniref:Uncharacterized protein n=1 Tax=Cucumis sativus TaxID=3659 RepID=A0A0A0LX13_CUCSA|nr:protein TIFY 5A [Cucumis sativus]KGN65534.1 hypothetical protein Csa_020031 [Cucumis sativus]
MEPLSNFNLELCLSPPSSSPSTTTSTLPLASNSTSQPNHITPIGLFTPDLTEIQAKAIIVQATRQMEAERSRWRTCRISSSAERVLMTNGEASPSLRRSLQRFLQKRKLRIQTLSPYAH